MSLIVSYPQISIIIPVYDVTTYIERCIRSVMSQTYENIECIIVDDATPDDSILKCEQMIVGYQGSIKFIILRHQQNSGLSTARNTGLRAASGDYIFFLDADDELTVDCIGKLTSPALKDASLELIIGNVEFHSDGYPLPKTLLKREKNPELYLSSNKEIRDWFFEKNKHYNTFLEAWNRLISRNFLLQHHLFFKDGIVMESSLWNFHLIKYIRHLYIIPDVTYLYYKRPLSITTGISLDEKKRSVAIVYKEISENFTEGEKGREAKYYLRGILSNIIQNPQNQYIIGSAYLFRKALKEGCYPFDSTMLSIVLYLSKRKYGRSFYSLLLLIRKIIGY
jgi:glycosyltransferase involved in cell wall biosynthesis